MPGKKHIFIYASLALIIIFLLYAIFTPFFTSIYGYREIYIFRFNIVTDTGESIPNAKLGMKVGIIKNGKEYIESRGFDVSIKPDYYQLEYHFHGFRNRINDIVGLENTSPDTFFLTIEKSGFQSSVIQYSRNGLCKNYLEEKQLDEEQFSGQQGRFLFILPDIVLQRE